MGTLNQYLNLEIRELSSQSPLMQRCLERAMRVAKTDISVFIHGETGTGKTLLAQAIHNSSHRAPQEFVS
ncbi:MAG: sigma 54-interacting transcriptional regulator, partial [Lentisphaeraceae bacterium]|nr:sigma 54-interacting transcriptional regulator [Lentisphaeraceae bacterium]